MVNAAALPRLYSATFDDEFSSFTSSPRGGAVGWATELPFWGSEHTLAGNDESEYYVDSSQPNSPFSVSNGVLTIQASNAVTSGGNPLGLAYNSGVITTYKSFSQLYGYFDIRAQLPAGAGLWPAFWLMPTDLKTGPELDAFEVLGDKPDTLYASVHSANGQAALVQPLAVPDTSAAFHDYGVDWGPKTTVFYLDGQVIGSVATPADMNVPMYMILNLAVGGASSWPGAPNAQTQFPADMNIDYVHAYQTANTIGWTDPAPNQPAPLVLPAVQATAAPGNAFAYVFTEHYGNQDGGTPLGGIGVALLNAAGLIVATGVTDSSGFHTFSNLAAGTYRVQYIPPAQYSVRPGGYADASTGITGTFDLKAGQGYGVTYQLLTSSAELAGTVELDGAGAANVAVKLLDANHVPVATTLTDATGRFDFWTAAGQYTVEYDPPGGTALAAGGLADPATGLTVPVVLADAQDFLLVPEQLVSVPLTAATVATGPAPTVPAASAPAPTAAAPTVSAPTVAATGSDTVVYRFFDTVNGTQFLTSSAAEHDAVVKTRPDLVAEGVGIGAVATPGESADALPVYRFFDTRAGTHFYTSSSAERDSVIGTRPDLTFEGTSFYEHGVAHAGDAAVYRFFDAVNGTHFYTSSATERSSILATRADMVPEGIAFYAPTVS